MYSKTHVSALIKAVYLHSSNNANTSPYQAAIDGQNKDANLINATLSAGEAIQGGHGYLPGDFEMAKPSF